MGAFVCVDAFLCGILACMATVPENGTAERAVYDALHATWCSDDCEPECDVFLTEWHSGREFTSDDLALVIATVARYERERVTRWGSSPVTISTPSTTTTTTAPWVRGGVAPASYVLTSKLSHTK